MKNFDNFEKWVDAANEQVDQKPRYKPKSNLDKLRQLANDKNLKPKKKAVLKLVK